MQLDRMDIALIRALQNDARASNKELANMVGLAPSTTHGRLQKLLRDGVVKGFHAEASPESVGVGLEVMVFLRMAQHGRDAVRRTWDSLVAREEVVNAWYVGGEDDLVLHVALRDARHLQHFVTDVLGSEKDIGRVRTEIAFRHHRARLPIYLESP